MPRLFAYADAFAKSTLMTSSHDQVLGGNHRKSSGTGSSLQTRQGQSTGDHPSGLVLPLAPVPVRGLLCLIHRRTCLRCCGQQCRSRKEAARARQSSTCPCLATPPTCTRCGMRGRSATTVTPAVQAPTSRRVTPCVPQDRVRSCRRRVSCQPTLSLRLFQTESARVRHRRSVTNRSEGKRGAGRKSRKNERRSCIPSKLGHMHRASCAYLEHFKLCSSPKNFKGLKFW